MKSAGGKKAAATATAIATTKLCRFTEVLKYKYNSEKKHPIIYSLGKFRLQKNEEKNQPRKKKRRGKNGQEAETNAKRKAKEKAREEEEEDENEEKKINTVVEWIF